nr:MAG TPA: hypothetical protein [Caudoviricetes sp.]
MTQNRLPTSSIFNRHCGEYLLSFPCGGLVHPPQTERRVRFGCNSRTLHSFKK